MRFIRASSLSRGKGVLDADRALASAYSFFASPGGLAYQLFEQVAAR